MQYPQLQYLPEADDPSLTIETRQLVAQIIDNSGLMLPPADECVKSHFGRYGVNSLVPYSHHLGYHGIRALYHKEERRNLVVALVSWLNLQAVDMAGIALDPVDERAWAGVGRGWPLRLGRAGKGARLSIEPMPNTRFQYAIEFQPAEPDGIDFSVCFTFFRRPDSGPVRFRASWPCYLNAYTDVRFFYPQGVPSSWQWAALGEAPPIVLGATVGYAHQQTAYRPDRQAFPLGFGRIGERALILMFRDPRVSFFVVNAGGHFPISSVQNPAWDFEWTVEDYPLGQPVGFEGRLIYAEFKGEAAVLERYETWLGATH